MSILYAIALILLGLLVAPSLILSKQPKAKACFDKIAPAQAWIGLVSCVWGLWCFIVTLLHIGSAGQAPIWWLTALLTATVGAAIGYILGYSLIDQFILSRNAKAKMKGTVLLALLTPLKKKLGLVAVCLGLWMILASLIWA